MRTYLSTIIFAFIIFLSACQQTTSGDPIPQHDIIVINSKVLNEKRTITVWTPPDYNSTNTYPVLYMPDGGIKEDFPHIANTIAELIDKGDIDPLILVGIENTVRRRDLTGPSDVIDDAQIAPVEDGSTEFRKFIETELFPEIDKRYSTNNQRAIIGESVAGLFIVETFFLRPEMFDIYLAIDPSLWWNNHQLVQNATAHLQNYTGKAKKLWFTGSDAEDIYLHTEALKKVLSANAPDNIEWTYLPQPKEHHHTIFRATKVKAFKWGLWK